MATFSSSAVPLKKGDFLTNWCWHTTERKP